MPSRRNAPKTDACFGIPIGNALVNDISFFRSRSSPAFDESACIAITTNER